MKKKLPFILLLVVLRGFSQVPTPTLNLNITSHNEMQSTGPYPEPYNTYTFYAQTRDTLKKIVDMIVSKNAKYNLQSCQKFILGCLQHEQAATTNTDILQYAYEQGGMPFGNMIEIDPRSKTEPPTYNYNIADVAKLIDSTGARSSKNVGGFVYVNSTLTPGGSYTVGDWTSYTTAIPGTLGQQPWQANVIWGAGSVPPHTKDANNFGSWKPRGKNDSIDFYCHDPAQNIWLQGNGCSFVLTTTTNVNALIAQLRTEATKISNGTYPANKWYNGSIMINFKDFTSTSSPTFQMRANLSRIIDSVNVMVSQGKIVWKTITQKQTAFQAWSTANSIAYSQWKCGQTTTLAPTCALSGLKENSADDNLLKLAPNPASGKLLVSWSGQLNEHTSLAIYDPLGRKIYEEKMIRPVTEVNAENYAPGVYTLIMLNGARHSRPVKLLISH